MVGKAKTRTLAPFHHAFVALPLCRDSNTDRWRLFVHTEDCLKTEHPERYVHCRFFEQTAAPQNPWRLARAHTHALFCLQVYSQARRVRRPKSNLYAIFRFLLASDVVWFKACSLADAHFRFFSLLSSRFKFMWSTVLHSPYEWSIC